MSRRLSHHGRLFGLGLFAVFALVSIHDAMTPRTMRRWVGRLAFATNYLAMTKAW